MQARRGFEALSQFWNEEDTDDLEILSGMNVRHPLGHEFPAGNRPWTMAGEGSADRRSRLREQAPVRRDNMEPEPEERVAGPVQSPLARLL